jgi:hypothetical protein
MSDDSVRTAPEAGERAPVVGAERWRGWLFVAVLAAGALLVGPSRYPPILDLAQQLDQVRLAAEVIAGERPDLAIRWFGPNKLGYLPLALAHLVAPEGWAPRFAAWLLLAVGFAAVHLLARVTRQGAATTLLASTLVLGSSYYAGFFNFVVGWLGLAYWTRELDERRRRRAPWRVALSTAAGALLLYLAHGLWLVVLGLVVASWVLLHRFDLREFLARVAGVSVLAPLLLSFRDALTASGWQASGSVIISPLDRLSDLDVSASIAYGGLKGALEPGLFLILVVWLLGGAATTLHRRVGARSAFLFVAGTAFLALAFVGPFRVDQTILFSWRWGGPGFLALLFALEPVDLRPAIATGVAALVLGVQLITTGVAWRQFDREEAAGFAMCLGRIPRESSLLAVDGSPASRTLRLTPTLHLFAYAGYEKRAELSFSFVEYGSSLVGRADPDRSSMLGQWLLINPARVRGSHLDPFAYVLVHGPEEVAAALAGRTGRLRRIESSSTWSLFEVAGAHEGTSR